MRLGLALPNYGSEPLPETMLRVAQAAEAAAYDSVWVSDHLLVPQRFGPVYGRTLEPMLALGYLAGVTRRVSLATSVIILPQRDPILLAKQAAGIDQVSGGRLILGVGVGWMKEQYQFLRTDFTRRGRLADEWIRVMRNLWTEDPSTFHGEIIDYEDAYFQPKPVQSGGPPIVVGGASEAALRRAATLADGWHASAIPLTEFRQKAARVRELAGGRKMSISLRAYAALGPTAERHAHDPDVLIGGPPSAFIEQLGRYAEVGLDEVVCRFAFDDLDELFAQMELFAAEVMPAFRASGS